MKTIVISVGGSMINPGKVNILFLKKIKEIILNFSKKNKIVICTGGGAIAREYINALKDKNTYTKDIMGIHCTKQLLTSKPTNSLPWVGEGGGGCFFFWRTMKILQQKKSVRKRVCFF